MKNSFLILVTIFFLFGVDAIAQDRKLTLEKDSLHRMTHNSNLYFDVYDYKYSLPLISGVQLNIVGDSLIWKLKLLDGTSCKFKFINKVIENNLSWYLCSNNVPNLIIPFCYFVETSKLFIVANIKNNVSDICTQEIVFYSKNENRYFDSFTLNNSKCH